MYVITGSSALRLLRTIRCGAYFGATVRFTKAASAPDALDQDSVVVDTRVDLERFGDYGAFSKHDPLELGTFSRNRRPPLKSVHVRLLNAELPEGSFVRIDPDLFISSPELIACQMAKDATVMQLAQLIMELCGSYSLRPLADEDDCAFQIEAVTTVERIRAFANQVPRIPGRAKLKAALDLALDDSASPAETWLALSMGTPIDQGGWGLGPFVMNRQVKAPEHLAPYVTRSTCYVDVYSPVLHAGFEYMGANWHLDPALAGMVTGAWLDQWRREQASKATDDLRRLRDLQSIGVAIIPVTAADLRTPEAADRIAWAMAHAGEQRGAWDTQAWLASLDMATGRIARSRLLDELSPGNELY